MPTTKIEEIAGWAASAELSDVPEATVARARLQRANTIAAARAGASSGPVERLRSAVHGLEAEGACSVIGTSFCLTAPMATYTNAAASIAHDWDDYLYMGHTGHSSVWASHAVSEEVKADGDTALLAQILANEMSARLGAALVIGPHNGQFWSSIHCAGAAMAAGKVMGLDEGRLAHAIATALYQPPYGLWPGFMGPDTKVLTAAEPAAQGVRAAFLAAEGFTGPLDVIENPGGLMTSLSFQPRPRQLEAFGDVWLTDTLAFKPYPGCAYLQTSVDAMLRLIEEHKIGADQVDSVEVETSLITTGMEGLSRPAKITAVKVNFSVKLSLAVALVAGRLTPAELDTDWLFKNSDAIGKLADRINLRHGWDMTFNLLYGLAAGFDLVSDVRSIPVRRLPQIRQRMSDVGMAELGIQLNDIFRLIVHPRVRAYLIGQLSPRKVPRLLKRGNGSSGSLEEFDTSSFRLNFPAKVTVRLTDGSVLSASGSHPGASGSSYAEARDVVEKKWIETGGSEEDFAALVD